MNRARGPHGRARGIGPHSKPPPPRNMTYDMWRIGRYLAFVTCLATRATVKISAIVAFDREGGMEGG